MACRFRASATPSSDATAAPAASAGLGNRSDGISVWGGDHTFIFGNRIAFNGQTAVANQWSAAMTIRANSIHDNRSGIAVWMSPPPTVPAISGVGPNWVSETACAGCLVEVFSDGRDEAAWFEGVARANMSGSFTLTKSVAF